MARTRGLAEDRRASASASVSDNDWAPPVDDHASVSAAQRPTVRIDPSKERSMFTGLENVVAAGSAALFKKERDRRITTRQIRSAAGKRRGAKRDDRARRSVRRGGIVDRRRDPRRL